MTGKFEIVDVYAREYSEPDTEAGIEVLVRLAGGAAGRVVLPAAMLTDRKSATEYVNTVLCKHLLTKDAFVHGKKLHMICSAGSADSWVQMLYILAGVSLAMARACSAQTTVMNMKTARPYG